MIWIVPKSRQQDAYFRYWGQKAEPQGEKTATSSKSAIIGSGMECMAWNLLPKLLSQLSFYFPSSLLGDLWSQLLGTLHVAISPRAKTWMFPRDLTVLLPRKTPYIASWGHHLRIPLELGSLGSHTCHLWVKLSNLGSSQLMALGSFTL